MGQAASQCRGKESTSITCRQAAPLPCRTCSSAQAWRAGRDPWGAALYWGRDRHSKYLKKPLDTVRLDLEAQGCQLFMTSWRYLTTGNLRPSVHSSTASSSSSSLHYMAAAFTLLSPVQENSRTKDDPQCGYLPLQHHCRHPVLTAPVLTAPVLTASVLTVTVLLPPSLHQL